MRLLFFLGATYGGNVWASSGPSLDGSIVLVLLIRAVLVLSSGYNRWTACSIICFNSKCRKIMSDIFMLNSLLTHHHQEC